MQSLSMEWTQQVSSVRLQLEMCPRLASLVKTLSKLFNQLHRRLEGELILISNLLEMDTPSNFFLVEILYKIQVR